MNLSEISSRQNPLIKTVFSYRDKNKRDEDGVIVVEGETLLREAIENKTYPEFVFIRDDVSSKKSGYILNSLEEKDCNVVIASESCFEKVTTEKSSDGFVSVFSRNVLPKVKNVEENDAFCALENVQDPGNVGTVVRSALALGMRSVILIGCADPFSQKAVRASMGAVFSLPIMFFNKIEDMFGFLRENKIKSIAATLSRDSLDIRNIDFSRKVCVLIGNEGNGLSKSAVDLSDCKAIIPIQGAESLNAANAASIFMWEIRRGK